MALDTFFLGPLNFMVTALGSCVKWPQGVGTSGRGDFWAQSIEILVFASPTGYILISSGFPLLNWGVFYRFL